MARLNLLNTRTMDFGELMGNGKIYRVPPYQRDYSWSEEQWDDLWSDIVELQQTPDESHYMGAIVVEAVRDREYSVIDGQQRTTTLSILALAVIDRLYRLAEQGIEPDDNRERAQALRRTFIGERDPASLLESSKLFLNEVDDPFYQDYLVQLRTPVNVRRLSKSNQLLWQCFEYFRKQITESVAFRDHGESLARFLNESVSRQLLFIVITVEDEMNAYTVFETLNARGIELTTTDLLKNYLFSRVKVKSDLDALTRRWRSLVATVSAQRFPEFLRYHLQTTEPRVRSQRLFKIIRDRTKTPQDVFSLIDNLERRAELFAALGDQSHAFWIDRPDSRTHIRELALFRTRQMTPLLFAAYEQFDRAQFQSVLRLVSVLLFRYTVVGDRNTNALEPAFAGAARKIIDGEIAGAAALSRELRNVYVDDQAFEDDFRTLSMSPTGARKSLMKYILARLESALSGRQLNPETDPATVEHILPVNPGDWWEEHFDPGQVDEYSWRLGNLTLLEASLNRNVANSDYAAKLAAYRQSSYRLTRDLPEFAPTEWIPEVVDARQRLMASQAKQIWRTDF